MSARIVTGLIEPTRNGRENSYLCKRPSDLGAYVFVRLDRQPGPFEPFLIEVKFANNNGNSRQGRILASVNEMASELEALAKTALWERDRHGTSFARNLEIKVGIFDAELVQGQDFVPTRVVFRPAKGSALYEELGVSFTEALESEDTELIARAEASEFAADVVPAVGRGEMIAKMLERRHQAV